MTVPFRLPAGGLIDRTQPLTFTFDGRQVVAFRGDTVASALLANGIRIAGRSFKYHRPRGVLAHGTNEPNALVTVDRGQGAIEPNARATTVEAVQGLVVTSQNRWPSLTFDMGALAGLVSPLLGAGFYYKTFMWPRAFWRRLYEPAIRRMAGLGRAPTAPDPDFYASRFAHCDVLVVGAGPAGLSAAITAAKTGGSVFLVDEQPRLGGSLLDSTGDQEWLRGAVGAFGAFPNVRVLKRSTAFACDAAGNVAIAERITAHLESSAGLPRERLWQVRPRQVILATGAHERPMLFEGNDIPGVMLAESIKAYIVRYAVAPGRVLVILTTNASGYAAAVAAAETGLAVSVVDTRPREECGAELTAALATGIKVMNGYTPIKAKGSDCVRAVIVAPVDGNSTVELACDCVGMAGGWTPAVHLFSQAKGRIVFSEGVGEYVPGEGPHNIRCAGSCRGLLTLSECIADGAGTLIAGEGVQRQSSVQPNLGHQAAPGKTFLDFQHDVTVKDIDQAVAEGFDVPEHLKRYTTLGMATDQGKSSNVNGLRLLAARTKWAPASLAPTTFRPPYTPVTLGTIAGDGHGALFEPLRRTPIDPWAEQRGAVFENVGMWRRARYFPRPGEDMAAAVNRECVAVRASLGLYDASTLGKIEVAGADAAEFLNRIYVNSWMKLEPGRCRYGLMLKEDGYILDDGVVARLAPDRFHVTTTSGGAARVFAHMEEYRQTEWPALDVSLTSATEQWAVIAVQGPRARDLIAPFVSGIEMDGAAFPHMSIRCGTICDVPTRLFRVSFTGELGYEINIPADYGHAVWEKLMQAGTRFNITPYGTEAAHVLRAERGFIVVGQETDGTVTPDDVGLGVLVSKAKRDFVGMRSLARTDILGPSREQLVGIALESSHVVPDEGAQILSSQDIAPGSSLGHVTSAYWSANLGRSIVLALLSGGRSRYGARVFVTHGQHVVPAIVVEPVFFDKDGARVHG